MKKKLSYLEFYNKYIKSGTLPDDGLCNSISVEVLKLFKPTIENINDLRSNAFSTSFWASGLKWYDHVNNKARSFTELRQTIVLFCAAIKDEL